MARDDRPETIPELPPSPRSPEELDELWFQECERRMRAVERGEEQLVSWEDARAFIVGPKQSR